jgi:hypothetical protein
MLFGIGLLLVVSCELAVVVSWQLAVDSWQLFYQDQEVIKIIPKLWINVNSLPKSLFYVANCRLSTANFSMLPIANCSRDFGTNFPLQQATDN